MPGTYSCPAVLFPASASPHHLASHCATSISQICSWWPKRILKTFVLFTAHKNTCCIWTAPRQACLSGCSWPMLRLVTSEGWGGGGWEASYPTRKTFPPCLQPRVQHPHCELVVFFNINASSDKRAVGLLCRARLAWVQTCRMLKRMPQQRGLTLVGAVTAQWRAPDPCFEEAASVGALPCPCMALVCSTHFIPH